MVNGVITFSLGQASLSGNRATLSGAARVVTPVTDFGFIAGSENLLVVSAARAVVERRELAYNPLVLYGPPGTGKSLLADGIVAAWRERAPRSKIVQLSAADFARQCTAAIEDDTLAAQRAQWRDADLVVLDDLGQLGGKATPQQELKLLLDALDDDGPQLVLTSRLAPAEMSTLSVPLIGRLQAGLSLPLALPAAEARLALLKHYAASRAIELDPAAARELAGALTGAAPELFGALLELHVTQKTDPHATPGSAIGLEAVRTYLASREVRQEPNLRGITSLTAKYFGLKVADLTSPSRRRVVVLARGVAMYLARELTGKSLEQVGSHFGGRDHTTVLHSYRNTEERLRSDPDTRRAVNELRSMLAL